jgi:putative ABC transport system permease protein
MTERAVAILPTPIHAAVEKSPYALLMTPPQRGRASLRAAYAFPSALQALAANKGRSLLTTLGIIIGVASVIAIEALGQGATSSVSSQLQGLGTNILSVTPGSTQSFGAQGGAGTGTTLKLSDAEAIERQIPGITSLSPVDQGPAQVIAGAQNWQTQVQGVRASYQQLQDWQIDRGTFFSAEDDASSRSVAVLGQTVAKNLFPNGQSPIGQLIRVRNAPFTVVGVLANKGASFGRDQDDVVLVPLRAGQVRLFGSTSVNSISVEAADTSQMTQLGAAITQLLRERHGLRPGQSDDFSIRNNNDLIQRFASVTKTLSLFLGAVAAVSLIVGGIGIMNIMLVSVTERTREIGIRLAIGARPADVMSKFLIEAVVLSMLGGAIGIVIGSGVAFLLPLLGLPLSIPLTAIGLAFGFAALIGIFFGIYPARKASQLDPIQALRYE